MKQKFTIMFIFYRVSSVAVVPMSSRASSVEPEGLPLSLKEWLKPQSPVELEIQEMELFDFDTSDHRSWDRLFDEDESQFKERPLKLNGKLVPTKFIHSDPDNDSENEDEDEDDIFVFEEHALFTGSQ